MPGVLRDPDPKVTTGVRVTVVRGRIEEMRANRQTSEGFASSN